MRRKISKKVDKDSYKTGTLTVRLVTEDRIRLEQVCRLLNTNCADFIRRLLEDYYIDKKDFLQDALKKQKEIDELFKDMN